MTSSNLKISFSVHHTCKREASVFKISALGPFLKTCVLVPENAVYMRTERGQGEKLFVFKNVRIRVSLKCHPSPPDYTHVDGASVNTVRVTILTQWEAITTSDYSM